jgi:hypothetical protein
MEKDASVPVVERDPVRVEEATYPVAVHVKPSLERRNRLTAAFRFFLALPHIILVGAPIAMVSSASWSSDGGGWEFGSGGGLVSVVAVLGAMLAWFALVIAGRHPDALWRLGAFYLRWRVNAAAYLTLLRDEYPPFGRGDYPVELVIPRPEGPRDRLTVAFRLLLAVPHLFLLWVLGVAWAFTTAVAWVAILFTGVYPAALYGFALGVLSWTARVEAWMLLLRDEYPPFTLRT